MYCTFKGPQIVRKCAGSEKFTGTRSSPCKFSDWRSEKLNLINVAAKLKMHVTE